MSHAVHDILRALAEYEDTAASVGLELRVSLTETILRHLRRKDWSQRELAARTNLKEPYISRILHSNANCTLDTAGKFLHALGIRARFQEVPQTAGDVVYYDSSDAVNAVFKLVAVQEEIDGQELSQETTSTGGQETFTACAL